MDQSQYSLNPSDENEDFFSNDHINFDAQSKDGLYDSSPKSIEQSNSRKDRDQHGVDGDSEIEEAWKHKDETKEKKKKGRLFT